MEHPAGASGRPLMTNRSWTPPSVENRTSRTGPFPLRIGTVVVTRASWAAEDSAGFVWGFTEGLDPPTAGCLWQPAQLSRLKRGPNPASVPGTLPVTDATSLNESSPALKNFASLVVKPAIAPPAPAAPLRGPGSV